MKDTENIYPSLGEDDPGKTSYQPKRNAAQLNHISVGDTVQSPHPGVEHCDQCRDDHGGVKGNHQDNGESCPWVRNSFNFTILCVLEK